MALISCYNILTSLTILMIFLPFHLEAYYTTNTGCHHNGTWYADKSLVPTTEKCLNCQCNKKTLVCRLKVCPEMPMPPPRGCVVVQKKNTCCPYLSCARLDAFYKIPATRRIIAYLDHYERESIDRVVNENMLQRRSDDTDVELYVCVKNGTVYKSGSAMSSSNLCSYCYCIGGTEKCVKPKCMLPVEGCKPIFVDSTCCPVRYDCSSKQTGKSSQEVRYRKTSNKHYMRMSQRLQRNHGCTVGQQFYTEGQKMKTDKDKPCDICFCIRGQRKCAPKKCAPALRNCIPVVPKGQCCPSSYDCGSQRDYRRSQNSRQFNLFSLLFGKDEENDENAATELAAQYPHDREPVASLPPAKYKDSTTEKSFYDTLREGLEFIDNNNNQMIKDNMDLIDIPHNRPVRPSPTPIPLQAINNIPSTTEASFLDLLLGPAEISQQQIENSSEEAETLEEKTTAVNTGNINWVDILLAPDEEDLINETSTISEKTDKTDATGGDFEITTSTDRVDENETVTENEESVAEEEELMVSTTDKSLITTTESAAKDDATQIYANNLISETTLNSTKFTQPTTQKILITTKQPAAMSTTTTTYTLTAKPPIYSSTTTKKPSPLNQTLTQTSIASALATKVSQQNIVNKNHTQAKPEKNSDFLSQLLDGLSDILGRENKTRISAQHTGINKLNTNKTLISVKLPTPKPMPMFKPLPQDKVYTRINSKIANLTVRPPIISTKDSTIKPTFKPLPTENATSLSMATREKFKTTTSLTPKTTATKATGNATTTTTTATMVTPITSSTLKPVLIKTNPSILESEPLDQNAEPTLPPSLPNLKIIPFLPTDAVKADHNQAASYEFYHHSAAPIARIDYELYDDANLYPSITEKYPLYPDLEDGSKAEYIYKFNVEGPDSLVTSNAGNFEGTLGSPAFLKYDFAGTPSSTKGFSPPIKTEGGFVPKEPLIMDDDDHDNVSVKVVDSYHVTQHIIDITTAANILNTTKVIEITTPDPFKDVIRTEPPPDLTSLIEDKLKNLISKSNTTTTTELTTIITTNKQANGKPQNLTDTKSTMTFKTATQIKMTATHIGNNNKINRTPTVVGIDNNKMQHKIKQELGDDMNDEANINVNDVSTIPPFKTLPKAPQLIVHDYTSKESASKELAAAKSQTNNKLKQTETTISPIGSAPTKITTTATTMKRPVIANATAIKVNRNKTTNTIKQTQLQQQQQQQQQKPIKINKNSTLSGSEIKILASLPTTITTKRTSLSSSSSALPSSSSFNGSTGTVSTFKTKSNATLQVTSTKATQHHHHHKPTTNKTETLPTSITHSTTKTNTINIDRTFVATRRPQKPTPNAKVQAKSKPTSPTTKKTITTKPTTTIRTTTSIPSTSAAAPPAATSALLQRVPNKNPFFMSPFDKLPFMDASFEVKRKSATPPTTTTATTASSPQHFAVAATIATDDLLDGANDEQQDKDNNNNGDKLDSFTSASHKLMGLVHYKHTLNQMEGLEPTTQYRPQPSISTTTNSYHGNAQFSSRVSSPSSVATQQQQQQSSSLNSLIDPTGILKLAGCNIYGRMYRVGRIILELSSPCLECKCTEIGVKCGPLDC